MTKKDFFILIIKLFGLSSVITSLFAIFPAFLSYGIIGIDIITIVSMLLAFIFLLALFIALIFRSERVVTFLRLDKGFDDDRIELGTLKVKEIMQFGIIVIGGFLILYNISEFIAHTYFALRNDLEGQLYQEIEKMSWAISGLNIFVGYLLMTNHASLAKTLQVNVAREEIENDK